MDGDLSILENQRKMENIRLEKIKKEITKIIQRIWLINNRK